MSSKKFDIGNYNEGLTTRIDDHGNELWGLKKGFILENRSKEDCQEWFPTLDEARKFFHPIWYKNLIEMQEEDKKIENKKRRENILNDLKKEAEAEKEIEDAKKELEELKKQADAEVRNKKTIPKKGGD